MSSILGGLGSSSFSLGEEHGQDFTEHFILGNQVLKEDAERMIDFSAKTIRKGDLILVYNSSHMTFTSAKFDGYADGDRFLYDAGGDEIRIGSIKDVYKIKTRCQVNLFEDAPKRQQPIGVHWALHKEVCILDGQFPDYKELYRRSIPAEESTFKCLVKNSAFSQDITKFMEISLIKEIVKNHSFTDQLALTGLKIRSYNDAELIRQFDKAVKNLEDIVQEYRSIKDKNLSQAVIEKCRTANTVLKMTLNEIIRRGLEEQIS